MYQEEDQQVHQVITTTMVAARTIATVTVLLVATAVVAPVAGLDQALVGPLQALAAVAAIVGVPALLVALQGPEDQEDRDLEALVRQAVQAAAQEEVDPQEEANHQEAEAVQMEVMYLLAVLPMEDHLKALQEVLKILQQLREETLNHLPQKEMEEEDLVEVRSRNLNKRRLVEVL